MSEIYSVFSDFACDLATETESWEIQLIKKVKCPCLWLLPAPDDKMKEVLTRTVEEAKALVSKVGINVQTLIWSPKSKCLLFNQISFFMPQKQVQANVCVTMEMVKEALDQLRGAVMIVYPMGLPPHDPVRMELEEREDLSGTQVLFQ